VGDLAQSDDLQTQLTQLYLDTQERLASLNVNAVGPRGTTPLLVVCAAGVMADVQLLLGAGADATLEGGG
jgi:hypothetical protein